MTLTSKLWFQFSHVFKDIHLFSEETMKASNGAFLWALLSPSGKQHPLLLLSIWQLLEIYTDKKIVFNSEENVFILKMWSVTASTLQSLK